MSNNPEKLVQDLIMFYVKEHYKLYLKENRIDVIPQDTLDGVINNIYGDRPLINSWSASRLTRDFS